MNNVPKSTQVVINNEAKSSSDTEFLSTEDLDFLMTEDDDFLVTEESNIITNVLKST